MKKILSVMLIALLLTGVLTACGEEEAYQLYTAMNEAVGDVTSLEAKVDAKVSMETAGENVDMAMQMDVQEIIHSEIDMEMAMRMTIDMGEQGTTAATMYYKDGWIYQEIMGMKVKTAVSLEEAQELAGSDYMSALSFEQDAVSDSKVEDVDGGKRLSFTLKGEKLSEILAGMAGSMMDTASGGADMNMTFGDVSYTLLLDADHLPLEQHIVFSMEMEVEGESVKVHCDMNMTDLSYNSVDAIAYPADLADYMEI